MVSPVLWSRTELVLEVQCVVKCAFEWGYDQAKQSNSIPIKASPFTPIHNLEHHPGPDAMLWCFFSFSSTFVSPSSSHYCCAFPPRPRFRRHLQLPHLSPPLERLDLCHWAWFCALFAIAFLHCSVLPFCSSCIWIKGWYSLYTLKPRFKKKKLYFFSSAGKHV